LACRERTVDLKPHLRRMHLVITAIHEFIVTLGTYLDFTHYARYTILEALLEANYCTIFGSFSFNSTHCNPGKFWYLTV